MIIKYTFTFLITLSQLLLAHDQTTGKFVSLVPPDAINFLERKNQFANDCHTTLEVSNDPACKKEKLMSWELRLFTRPDIKSVTEEKIIVTAFPRKGLEAFYKTKDGKMNDLKLDQFDIDWVYGPYFDLTVSELDGDWIQLPKNPFSQPVWINPKIDWKVSDVKTMLKPISAENIYAFPSLGHIFITKIEKDIVYFRQEVPSDMPCNEDLDYNDKPHPKIILPPIQSKPIKYFYDSDGHLKLTTAYMRGC